MAHSNMRHDSFIYASWVLNICNMSRWSFATWVPYICDMSPLHLRHESMRNGTDTHTHTHMLMSWTQSYVWHDSSMRVTCHIHMRDMPHSYVWHNSFVCVTWLIHMCDMTHLYVWRDSFVCVTWLIHMCGMIPSCVWHDSIISAWYDSPKRYPAQYDASNSACQQQVCALDMVHSFIWDDASNCNTTRPYVTRLLQMRDVTHPYITCLVHKISSKVSRIRFCIYVTWLIHMWHDSFTGYPAKCHAFDSAYTWRDSSYVTWLAHRMSSRVSCIGFCIYVTWPIHTWHDSFTGCPATCHVSDSARQQRVRACYTPHASLRHDSSIYNTTHLYVMCLTHVRDVTHPYVTWLAYRTSSRVWRIRFCASTASLHTTCLRTARLP